LTKEFKRYPFYSEGVIKKLIEESPTPTPEQLAKIKGFVTAIGSKKFNSADPARWTGIDCRTTDICLLILWSEGLLELRQTVNGPVRWMPVTKENDNFF
jgi:hypothetical protein